MGCRRRSALPIALGVGLFALLLYSGTFGYPFIYDDFRYIRDNTLIRSMSNLLTLWTTSYPPDLPEARLYRPVSSASYMLDYTLWGLAPGMFHVTNALLHALASGLFVLLLATLGIPTAGLVVAGLAFAAHAVHTEVVTWIVGRAEVLAGIFSFAAALAWVSYRRSGRNRWLFAASLSYFLALGSKESAAPLPAVLLLGEYLGTIPLLEAPVRGRRTGFSALLRTSTLLPYLAPAVAFVGYALLRMDTLGRFETASPAAASGGGPSSTRIFSGIATVSDYVRLTLFPVGLRVDYSDLRSGSLLEPRVLAGLFIGVGLVVAAILLRRRAPHFSFWLGWFILFIFPFSVASMVTSIAAAVAERFLYIASAGFCALAGLAFARLWEERTAPAMRATTLLLATAALLALSWTTLERNRDWGDAESFWRAELARSPQSLKAHLGLGTVLWERGKDRDPKLVEESNTILQAGVALSEAQQARRFTSDHLLLANYYANNLYHQNRLSEALQQYEKLYPYLDRPIFSTTSRADYLVYYGASLEHAGRLDEARAAYERALTYRPGWSGPMTNLGNLENKAGRSEEAISRYREALAGDPDSGVAWANLGIVLLQTGRRSEALATLDSFIGTASETPDNLSLQGLLAGRLGLRERAIERYERALALDPNNTSYRSALEALRRLPT